MSRTPAPSLPVQLVCPPRTEMLHLVRQVVAAVCNQVGFSPDQTSMIEISVDEACANVIRHAYRGWKKKGKTDPTMRIEIQPGPDRFSVRVVDSGVGLPEVGLRPIASAEEYAAKAEPCGLGWFIMSRFMDEVACSSRAGSGTVVSMVKYLPRQPRGDKGPT